MGKTINFFPDQFCKGFDYRDKIHMNAFQLIMKAFYAMPAAIAGRDLSGVVDGIDSGALHGALNAVQNSISKKPSNQLYFGREDIVFDRNAAVQNLKEFQVQNLAGLSDFPEFLTDLMKTIDTLDMYDNEYEMFFDIQPMDSSGYDVELFETNIVHDQIAPGGSVTYYGAAGDSYRVQAKWFAGGFGVDFRLIKERKFFKIAKMAIANRVAAFKKKAEVFYALIEAIPAGLNIAWQAPDPAAMLVSDSAYTRSRDSETMNAAGQALITAHLDQPSIMPAGLNTKFKILCPYQLTDRLQKALTYRIQDLESAKKMVAYDFELHQTSLLTDPTVYYVAIPFGENTGGELMDFTEWNFFNIDNLMEKTAGWMSYTGNIGRTQQWRRCATA